MRLIHALFAVLAAYPAAATTCITYEPVKACERLNSSSIIVRGRVTDSPRAPGRYHYRLRVIEAFKGLRPEVTEFVVSALPILTDEPVFALGKEYLFYQPASLPASRAGEVLGAQLAAEWKGIENAPVLATGICDPTREVSPDDPDLAFLRNALRSSRSAPGWVEGRAAQNVDWPRRNEEFVAARDAVVKLIPATGPESRFGVDPDGTFRRDSIPPGEYRVEVASPMLGWAKAPGKVVVSPAGCAVVRASFESRSTLAGKILDAEGNPAPDVRVELGELLPGGGLRILPGTWANSNRDGEFRVPNVPVGRVVLGANLRGAPSAEEPFDSTYAPGTQKLAEARVFSLMPREHLTGIALQLPPPLPLGELFVDVVWPDGKPARGGARAFAHWNGARAAFENAPESGNRVKLRLALGRSYQVTADWLELGPGPSRHADDGPARTVDFQASGQVVTLKVGGSPKKRR